MIKKTLQNKIEKLRMEYLAAVKEAGQEKVFELAKTEVPEMVFNSCTIDGREMPLTNVRDIIENDHVSGSFRVSEIYEVKNIANTILRDLAAPSCDPVLSAADLQVLHYMMFFGIFKARGGEFRSKTNMRADQYGVRPEEIENGLKRAFSGYSNAEYFLDGITLYHCVLEDVLPFRDGNGRIGRVIMNRQLMKAGYPPVIIRNKNKKRDYYRYLTVFEETGDYSQMEEFLAGLVIEAFNKRIALLSGKETTDLTVWAAENGLAKNAAINKARRQTIPAFRLENKWVIAK